MAGYTLPKELSKKLKQEEVYQITNTFKNFDRDKNASIVMSDVHMCLHSLGERTKAKQEKELFSEHVVDGKISFVTFCQVLADFRAAASSPKASTAKPGLTHG
jgi:Ca2+-binding EF-hand superfamily protein